MDHGEGNRKRPIVHLLVEDELVVDDDGEAEEDPNGDIGVRENDFLQNTVTERAAFAHCRVDSREEEEICRRIQRNGDEEMAMEILRERD